MPKFISEEEIEQKKKNQKAEGIIEAPHDGKSLYERLQAEKDRKQQEYEYSTAFKNRIHRLDKDEADYLRSVSQIQRQNDIQQEKEAAALIQEAKACPVIITAASTSVTQRTFSTKGGQSQRTMLANALKRASNKSDSNSVQVKRSKMRSGDLANTSSNFLSDRTESSTSSTFSKCTNNSALETVGVLPGFAEYTSTDSDDSECSDSTDIEEAVCTLKYFSKSRDQEAEFVSDHLS